MYVIFSFLLFLKVAFKVGVWVFTLSNKLWKGVNHKHCLLYQKKINSFCIDHTKLPSLIHFTSIIQYWHKKKSDIFTKRKVSDFRHKKSDLRSEIEHFVLWRYVFLQVKVSTLRRGLRVCPEVTTFRLKLWWYSTKLYRYKTFPTPRLCIRPTGQKSQKRYNTLTEYYYYL